MVNHLARAVEMSELALPRLRELLFHPYAEQASIDHPAPGKAAVAHRSHESHESRAQLGPPHIVGSNDIEIAADLIAAHRLDREHSIDKLTGFHLGVWRYLPRITAVRVQVCVDAFLMKACSNSVGRDVHRLCSSSSGGPPISSSDREILILDRPRGFRRPVTDLLAKTGVL